MNEFQASWSISTECEKAAHQNGFRKNRGEQDGWFAFESTTVPGTIYLAAQSQRGPWYLSLSLRAVIDEIGHSGVIDELSMAPGPKPLPPTGMGLKTYAVASLSDLYTAISRVYDYSKSLPDTPLKLFYEKTHAMPNSTQAQRLYIERIGQDIFRDNLLAYWQRHCPLTGITDTALLRASHIIAWADCPNDGERLNVHNGLLLSALWDAAFDRALVTFEDNGTPLFSPALSCRARKYLTWDAPLKLTPEHCQRLSEHRKKFVANRDASKTLNSP